MKKTLSFDKNTILYGPPGTGKTYISAIYAVAICDGKSLDELQEYFYEDYSKIMLVLGDNGKKNDADKFIIAKETKANSIFRGDASAIDIPDYIYEIQEDAFSNIMSYVEITG